MVGGCISVNNKNHCYCNRTILGMSVVVDFSLIRWQNIRSMEALQQVERENLELRRKILELEEMLKNKEASNIQVSSLQSEKYKSILDLVKLSKADLASLKNEFLSQLSSQQYVIEGGSSRFAKIVGMCNTEIKDLNEKNAALNAKCKELETSNAALQVTKEKESKRLSAKCAELESEMQKLNAANITLLNDLKATEEKFDKANADLMTALSKNEVASTACCFPCCFTHV